MPNAENDAGRFLDDRDRDDIARAARWATYEGCSEVFAVVERIVARHVGNSARRPIPPAPCCAPDGDEEHCNHHPEWSDAHGCNHPDCKTTRPIPPGEPR